MLRSRWHIVALFGFIITTAWSVPTKNDIIWAYRVRIVSKKWAGVGCSVCFLNRGMSIVRVSSPGDLDFGLQWFVIRN